jgi:hypothetical protein
VRDEYSRYLLAVKVPANGRTETIQKELEKVFEIYGLPADDPERQWGAVCDGLGPWG